MIHIYYRHYNVSGREDWRPIWFDYEKCFLNLVKTIRNKDVRLTIIYDGDNTNNFIFNYPFKVKKISAGSDFISFRTTLEITKHEIESFSQDDIIYFLENDYLHSENWTEKVQSFFQGNISQNYLSLYDHNDKYMDSYDSLLSKIITTSNHHYRTTPSTCGSFLVTQKTFIEDYNFNIDVLDFCKSNTNLPIDHAKYLILTNIKNRKIFTPIPGLSTHCLNGLMSPTINWEKIIDE